MCNTRPWPISINLRARIHAENKQHMFSVQEALCKSLCLCRMYCRDIIDCPKCPHELAWESGVPITATNWPEWLKHFRDFVEISYARFGIMIFQNEYHVATWSAAFLHAENCTYILVWRKPNNIERRPLHRVTCKAHLFDMQFCSESE